MMDELAGRLDCLAVFMKLDEDPVFCAFRDLLACPDHRPLERQKKAARFTGLLYEHNTDDWADYLRRRILAMDTCLSYFSATEHELPERMVNTAMEELKTLSEACAVGPEQFDLPARTGWCAGRLDLQAEYLNRLMCIEQYGTGIFTQAVMFRLGPEDLKAVVHPDPVTFDQLYGYESQHAQMIENTEALLHGLPCSNLLLYGDAGTGKSAAIKALANRYAASGLRLIEVSRDALDQLPDLLDRLAMEPLKFIVYIDDLSFGENDDSFSQLKAVLEGSVSARAKNTVICATSNRRHLVKESIAARSGDDMHRRDTLQETLSLSQRFGRCLFFERPNAADYLELVHRIALEYGLDPSDPSLDLDREAEAYALALGGRSARTARQFVQTQAVRKGMEETTCCH